MQDRKGPLTGFTLGLDVIATLLLLFILAGLWLYRSEIFVIGGQVTRPGLIMMAGFALILLFNLAAVLWLGRSLFEGSGRKGLNAGLLVLGIVCLVFLGAEKVMTDEVAHETVGGWSIHGEYIMLYGMLLIQLVFNLLMGRRLLNARRGGKEHQEAMA